MPGKESDACASDSVKLNKTVLLAYTDITAVGSRTLLGLNMLKQYITLEVPEIASCRPACVRDGPLNPRDQHFSPLQILNCRYEEDGEEFSAVIVNTMVPADRCHCVINKIVDLCIESKVKKIILMAAVRWNITDSYLNKIYENTFNTEPVTECQPLPEDTKIADPFLCTLLQMLSIEEIPCNCLLVDGRKANYGAANTEDGSKQAIVQFQEILTKLTRLQFDQELSCSLMYKGTNLEDIDSVSMMYV